MRNTKYFDPNRHATWLELFFDLIYAVTIGEVTHILSHTHEGHLDPLQFWKFVLVFIPVLFPAPQRYAAFYLGILFDLLAFVFFCRVVSGPFQCIPNAWSNVWACSRSSYWESPFSACPRDWPTSTGLWRGS